MTVFLRKARQAHDPKMEGRVFELVKDHLKVLARSLVKGYDGDPTLQPTLLVDEAFLRLMRSGRDWESRSSFFRLAYGTMRRILITHQRRKRPRRMEMDAVEIIEDGSSPAPSRPMEDEELLHGVSAALQDFLDHGDPDLVNTFLLSFFHRIGRSAGLRAEDLLAEFTGERAPLREVADATGRSVPAEWRRLGKALDFLQAALRRRGVE
jgi:RNA polymerase sigma factor (sigma-70 family)